MTLKRNHEQRFKHQMSFTKTSQQHTPSFRLIALQR